MCTIKLILRQLLLAKKLYRDKLGILLRHQLDVGLFEDRRLTIEEMLREGLLPAALHEEVSIVFKKWKFSQTNKIIMPELSTRPTLAH